MSAWSYLLCCLKRVGELTTAATLVPLRVNQYVCDDVVLCCVVLRCSGALAVATRGGTRQVLSNLADESRVYVDAEGAAAEAHVFRRMLMVLKCVGRHSRGRECMRNQVSGCLPAHHQPPQIAPSTHGLIPLGQSIGATEIHGGRGGAAAAWPGL